MAVWEVIMTWFEGDSTVLWGGAAVVGGLAVWAGDGVWGLVAGSWVVLAVVGWAKERVKRWRRWRRRGGRWQGLRWGREGWVSWRGWGERRRRSVRFVDQGV